MGPENPSERDDGAELSLQASDHLYGGREATHRLHILVVGCGLGGLAAAHCLAQAGHEITILESGGVLEEVGAGLQVSPNASRLLARWGLAEKLAEAAVEPESVAFRRYSKGEIIGCSHWGSRMREMHGAPNYHIHRADLHKILLDLVSASPMMRVHLDSAVVAVDAIPKPRVSVALDSGRIVTGDLIVGADGVKSTVRSVVTGYTDRAEPTLDVAYRTVIPTNLFQDDPELKALIDTPEITAWLGPERHVLGYCIRAKREYNMAMVHHEGYMDEPWTTECDIEKLRETFADFEPRVAKLLSHVKVTHKWKLMDRDPLETYIHPLGRVVLIGDACHPMLPYRAQGAAMAFEDAAVLGSLLSRLSSSSHLKPLLLGYESIRRPRVTKTQLSSRMNQFIFHLPDGLAQEERDSQMRQAMATELDHLHSEEGSRLIDGFNEGNANQWADRRKSIEQFSYDADAAAETWWNEEGKSLMGRTEI